MDYRTQPLARYLEDASAAEPTPGGGSVAAMAGALASTMASMAAAFTAGKEKYRSVEDEMVDALARLADLRDRLLDLAHDDMLAYSAIMIAWRLPKETDDEKAARAQAIADATKASLATVGSVLSACRDILQVSRRLADIANPNLVSDVGVAAELALGAIQAARINVEVNLAGYREADAAAVRTHTDETLAEAERLARETRKIVLDRLMK